MKFIHDSVLTGGAEFEREDGMASDKMASTAF